MDSSAEHEVRGRPPSSVATAANTVALLAAALAFAGFAGLRGEWLDPLVAQGAMIVAIGGSLLGGTLSVVGLLVTRHGRDPIGRRRAWVGGVLSVGLLVVLVAGFPHALRGPVVVDDAGEIGSVAPARGSESG